MKELRIPSTILPTTENMHLLIGQVKYKLVFGRQLRTFECKILKRVRELRFSAKQLFCHVHCS